MSYLSFSEKKKGKRWSGVEASTGDVNPYNVNKKIKLHKDYEIGKTTVSQ